MIDDPILPREAESLIPIDQAREIRRLSHDLSNALEIIIQTSYLLSTLELDKDGKDWLALLDSGVQQSAVINASLREYIRKHS
jgi:hypothetical protein